MDRIQPLFMRGSSMRSKIYFVFIGILLVLGIGVFVCPQKTMSESEKRYLSTNSDISYSNLDGDVNSLLKDQFYGREYLMKFYYNAKLLFNKVSNKAIEVVRGIKNGKSVTADYTYLTDNVIDIGDGYLINNVLVYDEDKYKMACQRGYNLNEVSLAFPDVKMYVYFPTKLEEILQVGDTNYGLGYRQGFLRELNENITYSSLNITSVDEHKEYFYKTDFHWNGRGAYLGYKDIINMIGQDFDLGEIKEVEEEMVYDYPWQGGTSGEIAHTGDDDYIIDLKLKDIGEYTYYINDVETEYGSQKEYYKENGNSSEYSDYDIYFGDNSFQKRFEFNDDSKPNILIFCDSMCNVNQEWIASHFNTTLYIDLRANDGTFNLADLIEKYDIDIILDTQIYKNLYFNGNMFIPLD